MLEMFRHSCICTLKDKDVQRNIGMAVIIDQNPKSWMVYADKLHLKEQQQLERHITDDAKNSFYLARVAAKTALTNLTGEKDHETWVDHGVFGFPVLESNTNGFEITLAHTKSSGFAVCFDQRDKIGIDIEKIEKAKNTIIETALTNNELALVSSSEPERSLHLHLIWTAREALSKALKTGFLIPLELLAVESFEKKNNFYNIRFTHFSLFQVNAFQLKNYVCTIAFPERCNLNIDPILELKQLYENGYSTIE